MITRLGASSLVLALALALGLAPGVVAETNVWELGHPDAKLLMGIDLKGLRESAAGQAVRSQWNAQPQPIGPAALALGFLSQIDRVFISSPSLASAVNRTSEKTPGKAPGSAAVKTPAAATNPPFLAVVEGTVPLQQLLAFLPGTSHRYHEVDVFRGAKATDASMAMLDARTIVLGDEKSVLAAIDRRGRALPPASAILKRAQAMASTHEFWVVADDSFSKFQPAGAGVANPIAQQIASQLKGFDAGISVRDGFQFEMSLSTASEAVAAQLSQLLSAQITQAMALQANNPQAAEMSKRLHVDTDGARLRLSLAMTGDELAQQMRTAQAALAARSAAQVNGRPGGSPQPPPGPPGKVKIYGLDDGVREIQLSH